MLLKNVSQLRMGNPTTPLYSEIIKLEKFFDEKKTKRFHAST